ncbi:phosphoenolpyruvate synthase [Robertkochia marina]|uniref:Phosphoenolpyruvate synthase n=1 Tax=Robertkochia marina TaxID=1227945 RepID=A0A4S3LYD2_9FLAO|nr:phosphoenolpyruvate synthase [Robertkochia marina]THD66598.1 phosphoenolpyruvate synthase [Robertkochia marina]TRZ45563.1 phosphoenolpyruvate synthase [Robertkochia marina]
MTSKNQTNNYVIFLEEIGMDDLLKVGGKNASLGEMISNLTAQGIKIPNGFAVTADAFDAFIEENDLREKIEDILQQLNVDDIVNLRRTGSEIRKLISNGKFPVGVEKAILNSYYELSESYGQEATDIAVRSSATAEDLPDASFAGQQSTFLNIRGGEMLLTAIRSCFASLYTDRAISYRSSRGFDHFAVKLSVCVQKMVRSDLGVSGVAFSLDTESGFKDLVLINAAFGLGELVVGGEIMPDEFLVFKPALKKGYPSVIEKKLGKKTHKLIYGHKPFETVKKVPVEQSQQMAFCLEDEQILQLARWVQKIEDYYSGRKGGWCPMDIEWAVDGLSGELFIVQARPETIHSQQEQDRIREFQIEENGLAEKLLLEGIAVGEKVGVGKARRIFTLDGRDGSADELEFQEGEILVTEMTDPDWEPLMKKASAIITEKGGRTCHAAIVAREIGVPAIVGAAEATLKIKDGQELTVSCAEGTTGKVYMGHVNYKLIETPYTDFPKTTTPIMMNIGSPDLALQFNKIPNSGVGLAREEFIINNHIKVHPMALLKHREIGDKELSAEIAKIIKGYTNEEEFFINNLAQGVAKIAAAFYPKRVITRLSDFKSNEYFNLLGGQFFEPEEENPMIGWRGASRYYSPDFREAFDLECKALKMVRDDFGLDNITIMIPFCRTPGELEKILTIMEESGLKRGERNLEIYLMAEIPSNIILAEQFAPMIDGFSIGSNDLTQLTLGLDRDSSLVAHLYDERNEAVKTMIRSLIRTAHNHGVKVGICGQGPSDFPDFSEFLVQEGIDSISVTPDSMLKTLKVISAVEAIGKVNTT